MRFSHSLFLIALISSCAAVALAAPPEGDAATAPEVGVVAEAAAVQPVGGGGAGEALPAEAPEPERARPDEALNEVRRLIAGGTVGLAARMIDAKQPPYSLEARYGWLEWEGERLGLYERRGDWQALVERVQGYPSDLPPGFLRQARTRQAAALLSLGQPAKALQALRALIWQAGDADARQFAEWRRMVIHAYLLQGLAQDAHIAMLRYQQDYPESGGDWQLLRARVLLQAGRNAEAHELLRDAQGADAMILRLLAGMRAGRSTPPQVIAHARQILGVSGYTTGQQWLLWNIAAEAAEKSSDHARRADALEHALALRGQGVAPDDFFDAQADLLWEAYRDHAQAAGNEGLLLVGDDPAWFDLAQQLSTEDSLKARSLYAYLALRAEAPGDAALAHQKLSALLRESPHGGDVLHQLYLASTRFPTVEAIPDLQRYQLAEKSLAQGDIRLASRLMSGLDRPPAETDDFQWDLRRARVHVVAGNHAEGDAVLQNLLAGCQAYGPEQIDRLMQVLFDLQGAGQHEYAYRRFESVLGCPVSDDLRREIHYWMADSCKALGRYDEAAMLYLRSAGFFEPDSMDLWAQSARFQAGEMLVRLGLMQDARHVYEALLAVTRDEGQRALLQRLIRQSWQAQP